MLMTAEKELIEQFKKTGAFSPAAIRLTRLINHPGAIPRDFEDVIRADAALSARLLSLVSSPHSPLARKADSIAMAVALLGMKNLHAMVITDAVRVMARAVLSPGHFWRHAAAAAICCKMIAERIFTLHGDEAYLGGILHDIGLIVALGAGQPGSGSLAEQAAGDTANSLAEERRLLQIDHCRIGWLLAQDWCLPLPVAEAIRDHHLQQGDIAPSSLTGILQISEYITCCLGLGIGRQSRTVSLSPSLAAHLQKNLEEYRVIAEDMPDELRKMRALYDETGTSA